MSSMMSVMASTEVDMSGNNIEDLKVAARKVEQIMLNTPGVIKTSSNLTSDATQAKIQIDPLEMYECRPHCGAGGKRDVQCQQWCGSDGYDDWH